MTRGHFITGGYNAVSSHIYLLKPTITYTDTYGNAARPVIDVGAQSAGTSGDRILDYPYAYRKNVHVIYQEPDTSSVTNTAAEAWGTNKDMLFTQVNADKILSDYKNQSTTEELLNAYRLNIKDDGDNSVGKMLEQVYCDSEGNYLSPIKVGTGAQAQQLPMIVLDTQYGTVDQMMTSVIAALTNAGGVQNSGGTNREPIYDKGLYNITDITVQRMEVKNGTIQPATGNASLGVDKNNDLIEIVYRNYDTAVEGEEETFSLLSITYGKNYTSIGGSTVTDRKVTLHIPVFVIERLTIDTHFKIIEGNVYNVEHAKDKGISVDALLANNSIYTLYTEYIYGNARYKYSTDTNPITIEKTIGIYNRTNDEDDKPVIEWDTFLPGTRLTLIDVCDSDKVYFYTVRGDEGNADPAAIRYTDFKDASGAPYINKQIHKNNGMEIHTGDSDLFETKDTDGTGGHDNKTFTYQDVAVERFLIVVDPSMVEKNKLENTRDIRNYSVTPILTLNTEKRSTLTEHTELKVTRQPGLTIRLYKNPEEKPKDRDKEAKIVGKIDAGSEVVIEGTFEVKGDNAYWERVLTNLTSTIDSANHGKYLELGIYLTDGSNNRINLPNNTNVTIGGAERLEPLGEVTVLEDALGACIDKSAVYVYKDGSVMFPLDDLKDLIAEDKLVNGTTNGVIAVKHKVILNFLSADLSNYTNENYTVHLELLRVEEPDYPMGGEIIDVYTDNVAGARRTDIACALEAEDLLQLGINTFENQTEMPHTIDFDFKMDFNGVLGRGIEANKEIASKYYTVTYRLLEKTNRNGTPEYIPYTGDQLYFEVNSPLGEVLQKGASSTDNEINSRFITYKFDLSEIEDGTNNELKGVIIRKLGLTVLDANKMDLSNYKIQASVMVSDTEPNDIDQEVNTSLSDFLVFTVAKLKTDLDY